MPSDLQRVAQGLVECLDEVPQIVALLQKTAMRLREQASWIGDLAGRNPYGRQTALLLHDAARWCDDAAYNAGLAPPKAMVWAQTMVAGGGSPSHSAASAGVAHRDASAGIAPAATSQNPKRTTRAAGEEATAGATEGDGAHTGSEIGAKAGQLSSSNPKHRAALNDPPPNSMIMVDGRFLYYTDEDGQTVRASATLNIIDIEHPRDTSAQRRLPGKLPGDHAGHIFARIFQGPAGIVNLTPMEGAKVNLAQYATLERIWRRAIEALEQIGVSVDMTYGARCNRPDTIVVQYSISGGPLRKLRIRNTPRDEEGS